MTIVELGVEPSPEPLKLWMTRNVCPAADGAVPSADANARLNTNIRHTLPLTSCTSNDLLESSCVVRTRLANFEELSRNYRRSCGLGDVALRRRISERTLCRISSSGQILTVGKTAINSCIEPILLVSRYARQTRR